MMRARVGRRFLYSSAWAILLHSGRQRGDPYRLGFRHKKSWALHRVLLDHSSDTPMSQ